VRIQANRFGVCGNRDGEVFGFVSRADRLGPAQIRVEGGRIARPAELDFGRDIPKECHFQGAGYRGGDLGLKFEHISQVPVIGLRPQVKARDCIDQLRGDADGVRRAPDAAFEDCADVELVGNGGNIRVFFERERGGTRCDLQLVDLGERVEQLLGESVGEVLLLLVAA